MPITKQGSFNLDKAILKFKKEKAALPKILGNSAKNHFLKGFRQSGGQTDKGTWKPRKFAADDGKTGSLLVQSGSLRRSIKIRSATFNSIVIASLGVKYAAIHNEGGTTHPRVTPKMRGWARAKFKKTGNPIYNAIANTKKTRLDIEIPQRQFVGRSRILEARLLKRIIKETNKVFV